MKAPSYCTTPEEHTEGFEISMDGATLNKERIYLTGRKKTHNQKACPGCGLWSIVEPVKPIEVNN